MLAKRWAAFFAGLLFAALLPASVARGQEQPWPDCLIVAASPELQIEAKKVYNLAGHFAVNRRLVTAEELGSKDLGSYRYVIVVQNTPDRALESAVKSLAGNQADVLWVGASESDRRINAISVSYGGQSWPQRYTVVYPKSNEVPQRVFATVSDGLQAYPLALREGRQWFYLSMQLDDVMGKVFADWLHAFFGAAHSHETRSAFIRIEDVHPLTDPDKLRQIADYLYSRDIPFMVAVIPVFDDRANGTKVSFEDKPDFTQALRYMVDHGASLIMHGYEHRYRSGETGEGFEFWDSETDKPIENEEPYTAAKLEKGIARMVANQLYPVAFEPPHYAMSQKGYQIARRYFSTLVASMQLSDETNMVAQQSPYRLITDYNGLAVVPETIGYVVNAPGDIAGMLEEADKLTIVRDSVVGAFFHPYVPISKLKELVTGLEPMGLAFLDLKSETNAVKTDFVAIATDEDGLEAEVTDRVKLDTLSRWEKRSVWMNYASFAITWGIAIVVMAFVAAFIWFIWRLRRNRRYRLFGEENGE
ncbi:DUF2334 domain-containing protein [Paenibacillus xanthanilyticus]|uniref:DUF2334 domain-containing protein n=1 Tax=Paenibacillus xanthanilyticus TaxID=1783531 RepID=A0ABV8K0F9_9BACL